jgi:hypothetical protein
VPQQIEALWMGIGRGEAEHDFSECAGHGISLQLRRKPDVEPPQIEAGEEVQLAVLPQQKLRLTFTQ